MNLFVSLKYLVALDDHKHFGRAALACHVTQPALSNALRALEENYGCSIVKRGRNFAGFTEEGERVLVSARRILREQDLLQQQVPAEPSEGLHIGAEMPWQDAATQALCLLSAEMHNRRIVDRAFAEAGVASVQAAIESNSTGALVACVMAGQVSSVLPGALLGEIQAYGPASCGLQARPLVAPQVAVPIALMLHQGSRPSRTMEAALALAEDPAWLAEAAQHSGLLRGR